MPDNLSGRDTIENDKTSPEQVEEFLYFYDSAADSGDPLLKHVNLARESAKQFALFTGLVPYRLQNRNLNIRHPLNRFLHLIGMNWIASFMRKSMQW